MIVYQYIAEALFYLFVILTFMGGFMAIRSRLLMHAVLGLMVSLFGIAGLYFYLGSPFLTMMQILIYVGAVCIIIVLGVMLGNTPDQLAIKNVTINEPFFQGHFPANPVMPGVLIIEAMAQAAGMLAHLAAEIKGEKGELYYLVKVDKAKFNRIIVPGDQVILDVIQKRIMRNMGQYECQALVDNVRVASCELLCAGKKA